MEATPTTVTSLTETLPKQVIIQSNLNDLYLHLYTENPDVPSALRYAGDYSFDLDTRFELEKSTTRTGLVHIRCMRNNKYWENFGTSNSWITATAVKPEENQSDAHCTLFQPVFVYSENNRALWLRHVKTSYYVRFFHGAGHYDGALFLSLDTHADEYCTFIDWASVVVLPDLIRIKGDNGNHLKAACDHGSVNFLDKADNSPDYEYEVSPSRNGGIRLKSSRYGTYWAGIEANDYLWLSTPNPAVHETRMVFLPTILDLAANRIIMKCLKNDKFCKRYTSNVNGDITSGLATRANYPDEFSSMDIEEPIISRQIYNIEYHLTDARRYNEKVYALITDDSINRTNGPLTSEVNLKTKVSNTTNWSNSVTLTVGGSMSFTAKVPLVAETGFEIHTEVSGSYNWGEEKTEEQEVGSVKTITVPPMTRVKASLMATRLSYDIPFSYTQRDVLTNGTTKLSEKHDGLFTGQNGYGYSYEVVEISLTGDDDECWSW